MKYWKIFTVLSFLISMGVMAALDWGDAHKLNRMSRTPAITRLGTELYQAQQFGAKGTYNFSDQGGAASDLSFKLEDGSPMKLPDNAIITNCFYDVVTAMASSGGSGTIHIRAQSSADLVSSVDADTVSGQVACDGPDGAVGNMIKLTAERTMTLAIGTEALTAGVVNLYVEYVLSD